MKEKVFLGVSVIGHVDHGKTTFSAALSQLYGIIKKQYADIDNAPEEKARGITIVAATIQLIVDFLAPNTDEYKSLSDEEKAKKENLTYDISLTDCPGHADFVKNMITGSSNSDLFILVIAATDGVMTQTTEHILLAKNQAKDRNPTILVFLNKCDIAESDFVDLVEGEIEELMAEHEISNFKIFRGSALKMLEGDASNTAVAEDMMKFIQSQPVPERAIDKEFRMCIEGTFNIPGRGLVISGKIEQGKVKAGDALEIIGFGDKTDVRVLSVQAFKSDIDVGLAGQNVGILIKSADGSKITDEIVTRGQIICQPGSMKQYEVFEGDMMVLGTRENLIAEGFRPQGYVGPTDVTIEITDIMNDSKTILKNQTAKVRIKTIKPIPGSKDKDIIRFSVREGDRTIAIMALKPVDTGAATA